MINEMKSGIEKAVPVKKTAIITGVEELAAGIFSMWIKEAEIAGGQSRGSFCPFIVRIKGNFCRALSVFVRLIRKAACCGLFTA